MAQLNYSEKKSDSVNLNVKCVCLLLTKHVCSNTLLKQQREDTNINLVIFLRYDKSKNIILQFAKENIYS